MSEPERKRYRGWQRIRPTIGLLMASNSPPWALPQWLGVVDAAWERDVNLLCFLGREWRTPVEPDVQANVLYELVDTERLDGLVIWAGGLDQFVSPAEMVEFCARYQPLPIVSVENGIAGIPSVLMDSYQAMRQALLHLIEGHGYRRIAYIPSWAVLQGTAVHHGMEERYRAYRETMAEHGLWDTNLIYPGRDNLEEVTAWLREQDLTRIEAIASSSDETALFALRALQSLEVQVPGEVALVGFNDNAEGRAITPPLTTVRPPFYEMGRKAVALLLAQLAGEEIPPQVVLPSELVIRRSCGCELPVVAAAAARCRPATGAKRALRDEAFKEGWVAQRAQVLFDMIQAAGTLSVGIVPEWAERLLDSFVEEMESGTTGPFLSTLEQVLRQTVAVGSDVIAWQGVLSALREHALPYLGNGERLVQAENMWQQARVLIGEAARRAEAYQALQAQQRAQALREIGQALAMTHSIEALTDVLASGLPRLGIPSGYLSLYEDARRPVAWSRLVLAYDEADAKRPGGRRELETTGVRFPSRRLLPEGLWPQERRVSYVVEPLYVRERQIGFALLEIGPRDGLVYEALRGELSNALQGTFLVQQLERRALQLQAAAQVSEAVSGILQPEELMQQVVELARERFDLYYAGLFLVDRTGEWSGEPGKWAVLRAGTGEAGRAMLAEGHKLEIGGASMIGWCIANKQARIALDVGAEAVRFENPHLPETRSELALPLVSRGEVIGALTIQSTQEAAFSEEDIVTLQTMAGQVANAIANARLYEALAREQYLMKALMDNVPDYIYFKDRASRFIRTTRSHARTFGLSDPAEAIGKTDFDFFSEEHARGAYEDEQRIIATGEPLLNIEERETWPDRPDTWVSTSKMPLRDEEGNIVGTFGISKDITDRKRAEIALARRALQLQTAAEVSEAASGILDPEALIQRVVNLLRERFDLYYAGLFLVDQTGEWSGEPGKWAVLRAGTGEAGRAMLAEGHKLEIGGASMIGWCIANKQARIALDVGAEAVRFENPYLPETRSELALPLISRGEAIGALTIQSAQEAAFSEEDIAILQTMASQVANAIENVRLFNQTQAALAEMEAIQRRYLERAWTEYMRTIAIGGYRQIGAEVQPLGKEALPEVRQAMAERRPLVWRDGGDKEPTLLVPIMLRGQPIGAIGFRAGGEKREWSAEDIALAEAISEQLALAAENLRLIDETQRRAARERLIGEITDKMRRAANVEGIIQAAVDALFSTLGTSRAFVRLGTVPSKGDGDGKDDT